MEDKYTIVIEEIINLSQERVVPAHTNVLKHKTRIQQIGKYTLIHRNTHLSHFQANNLRIRSRATGNFPIIAAQNPGSIRIATVRLNPLIAELGLVLSQCNPCNLAAVVFMCEGGKRTPAATDVEEVILRLEVEFLADDGELIVLKLFERLRLGEGSGDA